MKVIGLSIEILIFDDLEILEHFFGDHNFRGDIDVLLLDVLLEVGPLCFDAAFELFCYSDRFDVNVELLAIGHHQIKIVPDLDCELILSLLQLLYHR